MNVVDTPVGVLGAGFTLGTDDIVYPTIVLDVGDRPDVADLARVHAAEGVGDIATAGGVVDDGLLLVVGLTSPVRAAFAISVSDPEHLAVVREGAAEGHLLLATTVPDADGRVDESTWLAVDLEPGALTAVLDELARRAGDGETS